MHRANADKTNPTKDSSQVSHSPSSDHPHEKYPQTPTEKIQSSTRKNEKKKLKKNKRDQQMKHLSKALGIVMAGEKWWRRRRGRVEEGRREDKHGICGKKGDAVYIRSSWTAFAAGRWHRFLPLSRGILRGHPLCRLFGVGPQRRIIFYLLII